MTLFDLDISKQQENILSYAEGDIIFDAGEMGMEMFVVLEGDVLIVLEGAEIDRLAAGDLFGEMALVEDRPRSARAVARSESKLLRIRRDAFRSLVRESPDFVLHVMSIMSARLRRFIDEEVGRQRLEEQLRIGREIQLSLIPNGCPSLRGWEFAAVYEAAQQVGGDFYDFVFAPDNGSEMQMVIADVTGKGVPAALFMATCRTTIRSESLRGDGPAKTLRQANRVIATDTRYPLFLTAFCARLSADDGVVSYANGGHERPLWLRAATGKCEELDSHDPLLGFTRDMEYHEYRVELAADDLLVLFTDGVTEARAADGSFYGDERLQALVTSRQWPSAKALLEAIVDSVASFRDDTPPFDDMTMVVVRRTSG